MRAQRLKIDTKKCWAVHLASTWTAHRENFLWPCLTLPKIEQQAMAFRCEYLE